MAIAGLHDKAVMAADSQSPASQASRSIGMNSDIPADTMPNRQQRCVAAGRSPTA